MPPSSFLKATTGTGATATRAMISVTSCAYHLNHQEGEEATEQRESGQVSEEEEAEGEGEESEGEDEESEVDWEEQLEVKTNQLVSLLSHLPDGLQPEDEKVRRAL